MHRRTLLLIVGAFTLTRLAGVWLADHPETYGGDVTGDVAKYEIKAEAIIDLGWAPYSNVPVEYPPGSLPFLLGPQAVDAELSYRVKYIALMLLVDVFAFVGVLRLARRWGSALGAWMWVGLVPLLGPIVYLRLDLIPAVATIWALERASAGGSFGTGAWLSFGTIAKLYPVLLFPAALWSARRRWLLIVGGAVLLVPLIALGGNLDDVARTVFGYHASRGIQVESTWASGLLLAMRRGSESIIRLNFGAFHIEGGAADAVKTVATAFSIAALIGVTALALRRVPREEPRMLAAASFTSLAVMLASGLVFSPQFIVWVFALAAVALSVPDSPVKGAALLLIPAAALTQWVFPFLYDGILELDALGIFVLAVRNLVMIAIAGVAAWSLYRQPVVHWSARGEELGARRLARTG